GERMDRYEFIDYKEHAISRGSDSRAVAYIQLRTKDGRDVFGVGIDHNISMASIKGILCAINRGKKLEKQQEIAQQQQQQ
ncbi:MAG: alpha-isopropylmalate synthase regulatory domain-containing protein, partial [Candidatus Onthomonas sp.]